MLRTLRLNEMFTEGLAQKSFGTVTKLWDLYMEIV